MTFDSSLHEVCARVGVRYVITKFSRMDSLPNFLTQGAPQARDSRARELRYYPMPPAERTDCGRITASKIIKATPPFTFS